MIEQDDIENLEEAQEKLQNSEINEEYIPEVLGALVDSDPAISKISTSSEIRVEQKSEPIEIELQDSVMKTEEGKKAIEELVGNCSAPKKAIVSTLVFLEDNETATQEEIAEFAEYSDTTNVSKGCKELSSRGILEIDKSGEKARISLTDNWVENLIKIPEMKRKQQEVLEYL